MAAPTRKQPYRAGKRSLLRAAIEVAKADEQTRNDVEKAINCLGVNRLNLATSLSDDDVLAMADYHFTKSEDKRLHDLLELNGEGRLSTDQQSELDALMELWTNGVLRKSIGWAEAVRRCLRKSPF